MEDGYMKTWEECTSHFQVYRQMLLLNQIVLQFGDFLENDFWTPSPLLSILYIIFYDFQGI